MNKIMAYTYSFKGSTPKVGKFTYKVSLDTLDWLIFIELDNGEIIERITSTWKSAPCFGQTRVYEILNEYGFNLNREVSSTKIV